MYLPSDQHECGENSGHPRPRLKRADIQARKLLIGLVVYVATFVLFGLFLASPSSRKILFLWLAGTVAFYFCFAKLMVYSYGKDKRKLREKGDLPPD